MKVENRRFKRLFPLLKRALSLCVVFAITTTVLVGCSGGKQIKLSPDKPVAITIWHYYSGAQKTSFDAMVSEFNETVGLQKGVMVEAFNQGNVNDLTTNIIDSANRKVGSDPVPNIFAAYADTAFVIDKLDLVVPLDEYMSEADIGKYIPSYLDEGRMGNAGENNNGNKVKIFPIAKSTEIMILNTTDWEPFAKETGAKYEDLITFESIIETAKEYYEWSGGKALLGRDAMANYMLIGCKQLGVDIFQVENGKVSFNFDEKAFKKLWDCYYLPFVSGYFAANGKFRSDDAKVGDVLAVTGSTASATFFPTEVAKGNMEPYPIQSVCLPSPVFEGGEAYAVQQGAGMVVTKSTSLQEFASFMFLQWFTKPQRNLEFSLGSGYLPVTVEANKPEVWQKVLAESDIENDIVIQTLNVAFQTVEANNLYTNPAFSNGTASRKVLETSLFDKAIKDRAEVVTYISQGDSLEVAVSKVNTTVNFEKWMAELKKAINDTQLTVDN